MTQSVDSGSKAQNRVAVGYELLLQDPEEFLRRFVASIDSGSGLGQAGYGAAKELFNFVLVAHGREPFWIDDDAQA